MVRFTLLFILMILCAGLYSQSHYLIADMTAFKDKSRVILNWTLKRGSTCIGIGIYRSTDQENYDLIGEFKGVCGSIEFAQTYSFIDEKPIPNRTNYYVLELGFSGRTEPPLAIQYIDLESVPYRVIPNPIQDQAIIYFNNPSNNTHTLSIYDITGKLVMTEDTKNEQFQVYSHQILGNSGSIIDINHWYSFIISPSSASESVIGKLLFIGY